MKWIQWLGLICVGLCLASCGGGKYRDVKAAMNEQVAAMEGFVARIDKAGSGAEVAAALDRYTQDSVKMVERSKKMKDKYAGVDLSNAPELKAENEKMQQLAARFGQAFMKISMQYGQDPAVQDAMTKWRDSMKDAARF